MFYCLIRKKFSFRLNSVQLVLLQVDATDFVIQYLDKRHFCYF